MSTVGTRRRVPLVREAPADLDTPLSVYLKLANQPYTYLFESVQGGERWGRYSIIGLPCREILRVRGHELSVEIDGEIQQRETVDDPLAWIENYAAQFEVPALQDMPRLTGGLVGYFGYDTIRYIEPRLANNADWKVKPDPLGTPDILLMLSEELVVFDNLNGRLYAIVHADADCAEDQTRAEARLDAILADMQQPLSSQPPLKTSDSVDGLSDEAAFISGFTQSGFEAAVESIREYILAGDVMQVVPSQRLTADFAGSPLALYRALRGLNPSPYMYCLNLGDHQVVGASPEILVREEEGEITLRPLAGTRPRGHTEAEDKALEEEMLADPKEIAEHLMLIDLGRNDVGRVCETGSVRVTDQMIVERYSHVMHIVSNVVGKLKPGTTPMDALRATFPAGTLSGAPKIRAMEIIDELEPVRRGVYSGAVGYMAWNGNMDTAIAIRTAVIKDGQIHVQAGAGVVADSVPEKEWEETMNKARAAMRAAAMAESRS
ncbi:MAG: anthranilate synthase component I [Salinisphaeraceae bacterium]|nr:anthranilate synthase component I [Salinisphaeraceae bacterium]